MMKPSRKNHTGIATDIDAVLGDLSSRVVRIHASLAEATLDDLKARQWALAQLMELATHIERLRSTDPPDR